MSGNIFPKWVDTIRPVVGAVLLGAPVYVLSLVYFGFWPTTRVVGHMPKQPVPYSHAVHAGQLGMDCRYCHTTVEQAGFAAIPPTQTCMGCHKQVRAESPKLLPVRESYGSGNPVPWVKVHDLPDFVYFNHSAHVTRGVGCVECHGRVDQMEEVYQAKPLSMAFCLECHRNPDARLRPPEFVTKMDWTPPGDPAETGRQVRKALQINPSTDCDTCHR